MGPPGTAKSMISRRIAAAFKDFYKDGKFTTENGGYFEYLMNEFSTPDEICGPVDLSALNEKPSRYNRQTEGYLPKDFSDLLENDTSLKELAELIGRQEAEKERYEKELRDKVEIKTEFHPKSAYRGQISGLRLSGEISSELPTELAMSQNPVTKLYFAQKFAEKKLLSYSYTNQQKSFRMRSGTFYLT